MRRLLVMAAVAAGALSLGAERAQAQRWSAFQGCWRGTAADAAQMVCVLPGEDALSARFLSVSGGAVQSETVVRADNVERPVSDGGCTGTEKAFFSEDRRRIYTRAELDCNGTKRVSTGVIAMVTEMEWLDAQSVTVGDQHAARSMRYRAVSRGDVPSDIAAQLPADQRLAQEAARIDATAPLDASSVLDASRVLAPPVVEALLAARNHGFDLTANRLKLLKEQGVAASTIDVMVALSYPERFAVRERRSYDQVDTRGSAIDQRLDDWYRDCNSSLWTASRRYNRYDGCYDRYGFNAYRPGRYGYSPYGYDNYGWNYNGPIVVIVDPREETTGGSVTREGFTRGSSRPTSTAVPRSSGSSGGSSAAGTSSTSAGSSSQGSGSSTSSGTTTRTAKPRGGG